MIKRILYSLTRKGKREIQEKKRKQKEDEKFLKQLNDYINNEYIPKQKKLEEKKLREGYNENTWNTVENMLIEIDNYLDENCNKIFLSIIQQYNGKNEYKLYKNGIDYGNKKIDSIENKYNISAVCGVGCSACCNQLIIIRPCEVNIIKQALKKFSKEQKQIIKEKSQKILDTLDNLSFPYQLDMGLGNAYNKDQELQYLSLDMKCPLLSDDNKCTIYEVRPLSCCYYRNYGKTEHCNKRIAVHSCAYPELITPLLLALEKISESKFDDNTYAKLLPKVLVDLII